MTVVPPVLYSFRRCPYAIRARLALHVSGQTVDLREVVLRDKPGELVEASPKATVPVLVLPNGAVIEESLDLMRWALEMNDPERWWPDDAGERAQIDALIAANDGSFKHSLDRYKYPDRYENEMIYPAEHRATASAIVMGYEDRLADSGWLVAGRPTLADFAILPFVRQFAHVDRSWFDMQVWPNVVAWLDRFLASDRFAAVMAKYPQWRSGDAAIRFPQPAAERAV